MNIFESTRDKSLNTTASMAILNGLAEDGGLYMMNNLKEKQIDLNALLHQDYYGIAKVVLGTLLDDYTAEEIHDCVHGAYEHKFASDDITPLVKVKDDFILELFHGPTAAFKDIALSILPHFITTSLKKHHIEEEILILTATSGDTGKAALEGFKDVKGTQIIVFYPKNGVSAVQEAQMLTTTGSNVRVVGVEGNFDDTQNGVKAIFTNQEFDGLLKQSKTQFSSANSINIGRLTPQIVYYFKAYLDCVNRGEITMGEPMNFIVPTGNFGNILAGYFAKCVGLPIAQLVCASNENNVLTDFISTGIYDKNREFKKTTSPSMDILISSNLERLLYLLSEGNCDEVASYMKDLKEKGKYQVSDDLLKRLQADFYGGCLDSQEVAKVIKDVYEETHYLMDTHTAVAYGVAMKFKTAKINNYKNVILSTASPFKFTHSVYAAIHEECDTDEFVLMKRLSDETAVEIPENLRDLDLKGILHSDVIDKSEMSQYVRHCLEVKE